MKDINLTTEFSLSDNHTKSSTQSSPTPRRSISKKRVYIKRTTEKIKRWTHEECRMYEEFILHHSAVMNDSSVKRTEKIFLSMSEFIGSKTPSQCRSHHQKFFRRVVNEKTQFSKEDSQYSTGSGSRSQVMPEEPHCQLERACSLDLNLVRLSHEPFFSEEEICNGLTREYADWPHFAKGEKSLDNDHDLIF